MPACPPISLSLPSTVHPQTCLVFINTLRLNSRWDLAFLNPALHAQMALLQSSWVPQPCSHLWHHFSVQSMFKSSLFNCANLLPCFVWPPAYQGKPCWVQRSYSLKLDQLSCSLTLSTVTFHAIHSSWASQVCSCHVLVWDPAISLSPRNSLNSTTLCLLQPRPSYSWLALWKVCSLLEYLPSSASGTFLGIRKFSLQDCRSLDCLISVILALLFQQL